MTSAPRLGAAGIRPPKSSPRATDAMVAFTYRRDLSAPRQRHDEGLESRERGSALQFDISSTPSVPHARNTVGVGLPFASLALGHRGGGQYPSARVEEKTGTEFPFEFCHLSKDHCPVLTGIGSRRKRLLGVKTVDVYALGFYVDQNAVEKDLGPKYASESSSSLKKNQSLCDDVISAQDVEKTVRIVVTSGLVNHEKFLGGLRERLAPACAQAGDPNSLEKFEQLFDGANFRKGLEIALTSTRSGGLAARIDNRDVGEVTSAVFTKAFFGLYLGPDPVSPDGKKDISSGLADIVAKTSDAAEA